MTLRDDFETVRGVDRLSDDGEAALARIEASLETAEQRLAEGIAMCNAKIENARKTVELSRLERAADWERGYESGYDDRAKMDHDRADVIKTTNPFVAGLLAYEASWNARHAAEMPSPNAAREWIACSERMPERSARTWFVVDTSQRRVCAGSFTGVYWADEEKPGGPGWHPSAVTHWMPRVIEPAPEPPQSEGTKS